MSDTEALIEDFNTNHHQYHEHMKKIHEHQNDQTMVNAILGWIGDCQQFLDAANDAYERLDSRVQEHTGWWPQHYQEETAHIEKHQTIIDDYLRRLR